MIAFLLTPIGRYAAMAVAVVVVAGGLYLKIQNDAQADMRARASEDALRRIENAESAASRVPTDPNRVRDPDANERHE